MHSIDRYAIYPPVIWEDFERLCWDLWREIWHDPATQMHGRRGQKQRGVDIFGQPDKGAAWAAIQCKAKDFRLGAILTLAEIKAEIEQAKTFSPPLTELTIATTCPSDAELQEKVRQLSDDLRAQRLFSVTVLSWDEICRRLSAYPAVVERHFPAFAQRRLTDGVQTLSSNFAGCISNFLAEYLGGRGVTIPFGGRFSTMKELTDWLEAPSAQPYLLLAAPAGRGKSAVLAQWVSGQSIRSDLHVVYLPISVRFRTNLRSVIFPALAARLARIHGETPPSLANLPSEAGLGLVCDFLARPTPDGKPLLLVLDGLDEAADLSPGPDLIPLAPWPGLRVIVAVRSQIGDTDGSGWLAELGWADLDLAKKMTLDPLTPSGVAEVLHNMGNPLDALGKRTDVVNVLYDLTKGDPLLVRLYVNDLRRRSSEAPHLRIEDLRDFKPGFAGYIGRWWKEQRSLWKEHGHAEELEKESLVRTIFSIFTCALGPLLLDDLLQLLALRKSLSRNALRDCLAPLSRFVIGDGVSLGYTFSHPRMAIYFREEELSKEEEEAAKQLILSWCGKCLSDVSTGTMDPSTISAYIVQYFGAHLEATPGASDRLTALVDARWLAAWRQKDRTLIGFLNDVDRALNATERENERLLSSGERPTGYGTLFRGILCHASVNSLAGNVPADLLALLVKEQIWSPSHGLAYARRMANEWGLIDALATLAPLLPEAVLTECIDAIGSIPDVEMRVEAILAIAPELPKPMLEHVIAAASNFEGDLPKGDVIVAVSSRLDTEASGSAFALARTISDEESLAKSLIALSKNLPERYVDAAVDMALSFTQEEIRTDVMSCLISRLTTRSDIYKRALDSALSTSDEHVRVRLLVDFEKAATPEDLTKITASILGVSDSLLLEKGITCLARRRPQEILSILQELAPDLPHSSNRVLVAAAAALAPEEQESLAARLLRTPDDEGAASLLLQLVPALSETSVRLILGAVREPSRTVAERVTMMVALAARLPNAECNICMEDALDEAAAIDDETERYRMLRDLIPALPDDLFGRAAAAVASITAVSLRCELWDALSGDLPDSTFAILASAYIQQNAGALRDSEEALSLVPALTEDHLIGIIRSAVYSTAEKLDLVHASELFVEQKAFQRLVEEVTVHCKDDPSFYDFCIEHAAALPPPLLQELIAQICQIEDKHIRHNLMFTVAPGAPKGIRLRLLTDVLDDLQSIGDEESVLTAQSRLAPYLGEAYLINLFEGVRSIQSADARLSAFKAIVPRLPDRFHDDALDMAVKTFKSEQRTEALYTLAALQSGSARNRTLEAMHSALEPKDVVDCLVRLGARGDTHLAKLALSKLKDMDDPIAQACALVTLTRAGVISAKTAMLKAQSIKVPAVAAAAILHFATHWQQMQAEDWEPFLLKVKMLPRLLLLLREETPLPSRSFLNSFLAALPKMGGDRLIAEVIAKLLPYLPREHHDTLLQITADMHDPWLRAITQACLIPYVGEDRTDALIWALCAEHDDVQRAVTLSFAKSLVNPSFDPPFAIPLHEYALLVAAFPYLDQIPEHIQVWIRQSMENIRQNNRSKNILVELHACILDDCQRLHEALFTQDSIGSENSTETASKFYFLIKQKIENRVAYKHPKSSKYFTISFYIEEMNYALQDIIYEVDLEKSAAISNTSDQNDSSGNSSQTMFHSKSEDVLRELRNVERSERSAAVTRLIDLAPLLTKVSRKEEADEIFSAIRDIVRWFP